MVNFHVHSFPGPVKLQSLLITYHIAIAEYIALHHFFISVLSIRSATWSAAQNTSNVDGYNIHDSYILWACYVRYADTDIIYTSLRIHAAYIFE